jgi:hypothetical protein
MNGKDSQLSLCLIKHHSVGSWGGGARGSVVVKTLLYKPEGRVSETR